MKTFRVNETYRVVMLDSEWTHVIPFRIEKNWNGRFYSPEEDKPGEGEYEIDGDIKWDGCCNWKTNPDCMAHLCGMECMEEIAQCFRVVYALAATMMKADYDVPELQQEWTE